MAAFLKDGRAGRSTRAGTFISESARRLDIVSIRIEHEGTVPIGTLMSPARGAIYFLASSVLLRVLPVST